MRLTMVSPSAARPAMTSDTDARRSVAMTGAPRSLAVPSMVAVSPSSDIRAPNRASSCTCMKRFSKIVSVICEEPPAQAISAVVAGQAYPGLRVSVGNPHLACVVKDPLAGFDDASFDCVILSQTLQAMRHTEEIVVEMLRVGREAIVTFPNFGHWTHRLQILRGRMPVSSALPYQWYDTPNIHLCTVADFDAFLAALAGVPAGTWLGQQTSWRAAFLALSAIGLVTQLSVFGVRPDIMPQGEQTTSALLDEWPTYDSLTDPINRVFLPRADIATDTLVAGAGVCDVEAVRALGRSLGQCRLLMAK